uniref:Superoxide dismutase copper/zinc binding domain-containing protein n=1 Tax=Pygocentrus nattereri TaxID=42514 RepID=A0A3B4E5V7_PYGNA
YLFRCLGSSRGQIYFFQSSPQGATNLNISLTGLEARAAGYHVHLLPLKTGAEACSNENIMGHFNPYGVNISLSPAPGNGTVDQYEIGDISGKFGYLTDQTQFQNHYMDSNMPLSGPNSIIGRSLVIHYRNGTRLSLLLIFIDLSLFNNFCIRISKVFLGITELTCLHS